MNKGLELLNIISIFSCFRFKRQNSKPKVMGQVQHDYSIAPMLHRNTSVKCIRCARQMRQTNENKNNMLDVCIPEYRSGDFPQTKMSWSKLKFAISVLPRPLFHTDYEKENSQNGPSFFFGPVLLFLFDENFKGGSAIGLKLLLISNIQLVNESLIQDWLDSNRKSKIADWKNAKKREEKKTK